MRKIEQNLLVKEGKKLRQTRGVAPVTHQITDNTEQSHESNTSLLHTAVRILRKADIECATGIGVGEDFVASVDEGEG
jgi:hypothetical protein